MKNIVVVTGSARKGGNTDLLASAFIEGAEEAGHSVFRFDAAEKNIGDCKGCDLCFSTGHACVYNDDFRELAPMVEKADVLVLATPLYWFTFSAAIKAAMDKMYAFVCAKRQPVVQEAVLLVCGEDKKRSAFDGIVASYEIALAYAGWQDAGQIVVTDVLHKGDIKKTDALEKARQLGKNL